MNQREAEVILIGGSVALPAMDSNMCVSHSLSTDFLPDLEDIEKEKDDNKNGLRTVRNLQSKEEVIGRYWNS